MKIKKIISTVFLFFLFVVAGRGNAAPISENETFPDIPGAEKIVWHCDEGATVVVTYIKANEWWRSVIMTEIKNFAVESRANGVVRYFTAFPGDTKLQEISAEQYKSDLAFASPNYEKRMRGEQSDCVRL